MSPHCVDHVDEKGAPANRVGVSAREIVECDWQKGLCGQSFARVTANEASSSGHKDIGPRVKGRLLRYRPAELRINPASSNWLSPVTSPCLRSSLKIFTAILQIVLSRQPQSCMMPH